MMNEGTNQKKVKGIDNSAQKRHWVRLTRVCNQNCLFCLDKESQNGSVILIEEIKKDLQKGRENGAERVILSGGEATIHPDFLKVVALAKKIGYAHVQVISNGLRFSDPRFFDDAVKAGVDEMTFSIHGHTSELHDTLVGVRGAFVKAITALKNTKKYPKLIVSIDICINGLNYAYIPRMVKMFIDSGFYEFDLLHIIPFSSAWKNRKIMLFDVEKALPHLHRAFAFSKDPRVHIWTNRLPAQYLEGYENLIQDPSKIMDEVAGRTEMFDDLFMKGKAFHCKGDKCRYCFLEKFCSDVEKLKEEGVLEPERWPSCVEKVGAQKRAFALALRDVFDGKKADMKLLVDFYITERYFVKSLRCGSCRDKKHCSGAPITMIENEGFGVLHPRKRQKKI